MHATYVNFFYTHTVFAEINVHQKVSFQRGEYIKPMDCDERFFKGGSTWNRWTVMDDFSKGRVHKTDGLWWVIFQRGEYTKPMGFDGLFFKGGSTWNRIFPKAGWNGGSVLPHRNRTNMLFLYAWFFRWHWEMGVHRNISRNKRKSQNYSVPHPIRKWMYGMMIEKQWRRIVLEKENDDQPNHGLQHRVQFLRLNLQLYRKKNHCLVYYTTLTTTFPLEDGQRPSLHRGSAEKVQAFGAEAGFLGAFGSRGDPLS